MNNNRRFFMKSCVISIGALMVAPLLKIQQAFGAPVDANSVLAKALGYKDNIVAAEKALKAENKPLDRKDKKAFCNNCNYFITTDAKAKVAPCQLLANAEVSAEGWCKSWAKKEKKKA